MRFCENLEICVADDDEHDEEQYMFLSILFNDVDVMEGFLSRG